MKRFLDRPRNYCVNSSQSFNTIIAERNYEKCDNFNYSTLRVAHFPNYLSRVRKSFNDITTYTITTIYVHKFLIFI